MFLFMEYKTPQCALPNMSIQISSLFLTIAASAHRERANGQPARRELRQLIRHASLPEEYQRVRHL
jgi:hypothetical protein